MPYKFEHPKSERPTRGIYIHIPFCVKKCDYCDFYSIAATEGEKARYHRALLGWLDRHKSDGEGYTIDTVYIGGGTPSCYGAERLAELAASLREQYALSGDCEFTVECNPDTATEHWLTAMKGVGINRLSMGVQSANDEELRRVGRLHDFAVAAGAFRLARQIGFDNLSLDLIYGLPGQTMEGWQRSVEMVLRLEPDHLSCYGLKVEEGTRLYTRQKELTMADDDLQADMYLWMVDRLEQAGYGQYEISNFAKSGKHSRHNLRYWLGQEYLGFGPSAHGYRDGFRESIPRDLNAFCAGGDVWEERKPVDGKEQAREYLLLRLRTTWGIARQEYENRFGLDFTALEAKLETFARYGWATREDGRWHFTPKGFLVSNALIGRLLETQEPDLFE